MHLRTLRIFAVVSFCAGISHALTFSEWQAASFTPGQLADPAISAATADPDGDGMANLHEYVFFGEPFVNESLLLEPQLNQTAGALTLTYRERADLVDVRITLQSTADLTRWISYNSLPEVDRVAFTGYDNVTVADLAPQGDRRFLRLQLTMPPESRVLAVPTFVQIEAGTPSSWTVSWHDPNITETGYAVERRRSVDNTWERLVTLPADVNEWTHVTADALQGCAYRVIALGASAAELASDAIALPDTDSDGLPDPFELADAYVGAPGTYATDPNAADTDGDGVSDTQEIRGGTNPADYYNGQTPIISTVSGTDQTGPPGYFLLYPWVVKVTDVIGTPLANAPVTFTASGATVGFSIANDDSQPVQTTLIVRTDSQGLARAFWKL